MTRDREVKFKKKSREFSTNSTFTVKDIFSGKPTVSLKQAWVKPVVDAQPWRLGKTSRWRLPFSILAILVKGDGTAQRSPHL